MGDGTLENPFTLEDVRRLIEENGGTAKGLDLSKKVFQQGIDLRGIDLKEVILRDAIFPSFYDQNVIEIVDLTGVHLEKADLRRARLEGADLTTTHLEGANLWHAHLERARLWDTHLEGANLVGSHLEGVNLTRTKFSRDVSLEDVDWGNYMLDEEKPGGFDSAVASYRHLKVWYSNAGYSDTAAKFYYREKEANRKALKWCSKHWNDRLALEILRVLFGYGERWWNILGWMSFIIFGSMAAYYFSGALNLSYSLYFSVISFTALGYGKWVDITPQGWVQALGAAESFLGVLLMALFLVTFVRKWTR